MVHPTVKKAEEDEAEDEGNEWFGFHEDAMNTSYEEVKEEATPGEKVELAVHFYNKKIRRSAH